MSSFYREKIHPLLWEIVAILSCPCFYIFHFIVVLQKEKIELFDSFIIVFVFVLSVYAAKEQKGEISYNVTCGYALLLVYFSLVALVFMILDFNRYGHVLYAIYQYAFYIFLYGTISCKLRERYWNSVQIHTSGGRTFVRAGDTFSYRAPEINSHLHSEKEE